MIAARSTDYDLIRSIITHPKVWPHIVDDGTVSADLYQPNRDMIYVVVSDPEPIILFAFHPLNATTAMVHICALPEGWGRSAGATLAAFRWLFDNTAWAKIIGFVPAFNRRALALARRIGMEFEGVIKDSFALDGALHDLHIVGMRKGTLCH